ncbi:type III pantothenate kinase [Erysipelothrix urinaevulpis]|uniref:type III pantothenate kinase n=1 Tax=Erysipelothrix urinaevulpis TaxID=2683717 RepID=UPI00135CEC24|nr:type III pantothenate kinase [Erysipelothrix urinaevulpis]
MILTIDVGNSNTVMVAYNDEGTRVYEQRIITEKNKVETYYKEMFERIEVEVEAVVVSCVVPHVHDGLMKALKSVFASVVFVVSAKTVKSLTILLEDPMDIGADFIATSMGAMEKYNKPIIVADVGSATKLTYTDEDGNFCGGAILPGLGTSVKSLHDFIPHLPMVDIKLPKNAIGNSTIDAIQSGIMYGLIGQIEGIAKRMEDERGIKCVKIVTGGYGALIENELEGFIYDPFLLNDGLYAIYKKECLYES